jgi:prepilin-type processing-associated H-X9-DG protein
MTSKTVAIVGGGLSGTLVAMRLLEWARPPQMMRVLIIEPRPTLGPGLAYSTNYSGHLMNVRAARLSLRAEDPEHFVKWFQAHSDSSVSVDSFAPRFLYGSYAAELLAAAQAKAHPYVTLKHVRGEVVDLRCLDSGVELQLKGGSSLRADAAVLAPGNSPPSQEAVADPEFRSSPHYLDGVWQPRTVSLERDASVLLIGSGLTAIDVAVALNEAGFQGVIHVVSRRGLWPRVHAPHVATHNRTWEGEGFASLRGLLKVLRLEICQAEASGGDWRGVVDSLRPHANRLWQGLSAADQRGFFRHLRPYWEAHRHRMAPEVAKIVEGLAEQGRLRLHAGRVNVLFWDEEGAEVEIKLRGKSAGVVLRVNRIINCTAPESDYRKLTHPFWRNLFARGIAVAGRIGLGLRTGPEGQLINAGGEPSHHLFTLGATRIGTLFETTSVEEIRTQAAALASRLLNAICMPHTSAAMAVPNVQPDARGAVGQ